jgi:hypothetical protein
MLGLFRVFIARPILSIVLMAIFWVGFVKPLIGKLAACYAWMWPY